MRCVAVLTVVGVVGNALALLVLSTDLYSRKSYSHFLRALAVFDSLTLIIAGTGSGVRGPGSGVRGLGSRV